MNEEWQRMMNDDDIKLMRGFVDEQTNRQTNTHLWMWLKISLLATQFVSVGPAGLGKNEVICKFYLE